LHHAPTPALANNDAPSVSVALAHAAGNVAISAQNGSVSSSSDGSAIAAGSKITTRDGGHAVLALSSGTRIAVDDNSDLAVVEEDAVQIFSLNSGTMRADVAKLLPGQRFVIRTADSEVEVHGTSFSVTVVPQNAIDPNCGNGAATRVVVYEGIVSVRHAGIEAHVPKGNSWPSACASTATTNDDSPLDTNAAQPDPNSSTATIELPDDDTHATDLSTPAPSQHAHKSGTHHAKASSPLSEQNDIFESGLTAERDGLTNGAISDFERYLSLYPNGPLAEHAAVRRMNLLRTVDHARAVNAARDYLAKYPAGFARTEAQGIVRETR
jgi:FecR-like protein